MAPKAAAAAAPKGTAAAAAAAPKGEKKTKVERDEMVARPDQAAYQAEQDGFRAEIDVLQAQIVSGRRQRGEGGQRASGQDGARVARAMSMSSTDTRARVCVCSLAHAPCTPPVSRRLDRSPARVG